MCCSARLQFTLNQSSVAEIPEGVYGINVTITSFTGASNHGKLYFNKSGPGRVPAVTVDGGLYQSFTVQAGLRITTRLTAVCPNQVRLHERPTGTQK
jgi:hypothetical protein